jgi:hypothetical protein
MTASAPQATHRSTRRRFAPAALVAGVAASAVLALSMTGTLAAFTASITNSNDTAASGTLVMQEQNSDASVTCLSTDGAGNGINGNAATCASINKYGGSTSLVPGSVSTTTVRITNKGTISANTFTLTPAACVQSNNTAAGNTAGSASDFCSKLSVAVSEQVGSSAATTVVPTKTLTAFGTGTPVNLAKPVAPGATVTYVFTVTFDSTAGNTYQGLSASQPLTWSFTS